MEAIFDTEIKTQQKLKALRLGSVDNGAKPTDVTGFFRRYHADLFHFSMSRSHFRDEANNDWNSFSSTGKDNYVRRWQDFLQRVGFLPFHQEEGLFGYVTLAATRLFQEYIRTVEGIAEIGVPDGIVGSKTRQHANRWDNKKLRCHWFPAEQAQPSKEYTMWLQLLRDSKRHYLQQPHSVIQMAQQATNMGDSRKIQEWEWKPEDVHLLGIRRNQEKRSPGRGNDDLFVLLIRGQVFKFYGSTDPRPALTGRSDEPYLIEGQHKYRMAWHKIGQIHKVYKALKPYSGKGVLVFRDANNDDAFSEADIKKGLQPPNNSINIHWTGSGAKNWSAGCQVIAGNSYLNADNKLVDCTAFSASGYNALAMSGKTRGAYNVLCDLVLAFSGLNQDVVWYTLGRDDVLDLHPDLGADWARMMVENMTIK